MPLSLDLDAYDLGTNYNEKERILDSRVLGKY